MIRILHVVTHMNRGGLETMLMNYYRNIDRGKMQFDFLVHRANRADYDDEIESMGGRIYRISPLNPFDLKYRKELEGFFKKHKEYHIVHSHLDCLSAIPLKAAKKAGVKYCIAHGHNTNQDHNLKYLIKLYYRRKVFNYADKLFACSEAAGKWMFINHPFDVLPNAIDAEKFSYSLSVAADKRKEFGIVEDDFVVGHIGRFNHQKNHEFLIDVFAQIKKKKRSSKLLLVGVGNQENMIHEKVKKLRLQDSVIFTGLRSDIPELLSAMDVFVFPSLYEGLPVTLIEAQAAGLPCFISDKVPIECKKTNLVRQISLHKDASTWSNLILSKKYDIRRNTYDDICKAGFDIKVNAKKLQRFYECIEKGDCNPCLR